MIYFIVNYISNYQTYAFSYHWIFHLRPKSKDFPKAGNGGPGYSRKETHNECDIDNMTFENIFEDLFHFTSDNGSGEEE